MNRPTEPSDDADVSAPGRTRTCDQRLRSQGGYLRFAPREQRRGAGGWTKGRPIALKRLYDDRSAFDYLLPQDLEILRHLKREVSYGGYRNRYLDEHYFFDEEPALLAMAGHPNLVWEDAPERGVQLTVGRATLSVEPRDGGVFVRMDPASDREIAVRRPGPDRLEVVPLDRVHRQVASALGEGMWAPGSVVDDVRAAAERLAGHLAIHTGLDGWGARAVPADAIVRVHATDDGTALRVRCVVAPLGERGPELNPGEGAESVVGTSHGEAIQATRDLGAERAAQAEVLASCPTLAAALQDRGVWRVTDPQARRALVVELAALGDPR